MGNIKRCTTLQNPFALLMCGFQERADGCNGAAYLVLEAERSVLPLEHGDSCDALQELGISHLFDAVGRRTCGVVRADREELGIVLH